MTLTVVARCLVCDWTVTGTHAQWSRVDNAANAHTTRGPKHGTAVTATPDRKVKP